MRTATQHYQRLIDVADPAPPLSGGAARHSALAPHADHEWEKTVISGKRILIVEDEFLVAAMLEDELIEHGAQVIGPAATLDHGMTLALAGEFDCAVVDWNLDGDSSEPLGRVLAQAGIPFVISTGYGVVPAEFAGRPMLSKPYDPMELVAVLARLLVSD